MSDEPHDEPYVPPISKMHVVMYFIVFLVWGLIMVINTTTIETDPYFQWGIMFLLIWTYGFEVILPRAVNRSPKGVGGGIVGTSVTSGKPQKVIPPSGVFPEMGVWVANAIDAPRWSLKNYFAGNGYIIAPMRYSYQFGANWVWNVDFEMFVDHGRLPPHIKAALEVMDEPKYHPDWPAAFNMFPAKVNELSDADKFELQKDLRKIGFEGDLTGPIGVMEKYAATVSPFRYEERYLKADEMYKHAMAQVSKENDRLRQELRDQQDLTAKWKRAVLSPEQIAKGGFLSRVVGKEEEPEPRGEAR